MSGTMRQTVMTAAELLSLPDNGIERELIRGELREYSMTRRSREHARVEATIAAILKNWVWSQEKPCGIVYSGEVGCILERDPDTVVGIDVALFKAEEAVTKDPAVWLEGPPILAVEILSPNDTQKRINEKIDLYLSHGVGLVWVVDTHFRTVAIHEKGQQPTLFNADQELPIHPLLPGLTVSVAKIFAV
jgi:Uma2 family endonuclease